jgi:predicted TIM-barrel fold metal-dependent hydrolase
MTNICLPPESDPAAPSFALPAGATDCHMHLFGTASNYPYVAERDYTPSEAGVAAAKALYKTLGIGRVVAVQPSVYGTDNRCQLNFGAQLGLPFRAVIVPPSDTSARDLEDFHHKGVRGIRYILAHPGGLDVADLEHSADSARERGWHLEFLLKPHQLLELAPRLAKLRCPVSFDHLAFMKADEGVAQPAFQALLALLQAGNSWVKLSGAYRVSGTADRYQAVLPLARKIMDTRPDRVVWGSDWPHVGQMVKMPRTTPLVNLLQDWVPDEAARNRVLVDNAAMLYGFD